VSSGFWTEVRNIANTLVPRVTYIIIIGLVNSAADPNSITFRDTWLPTATKDATSFYQFLANVSLDMHWANGRELDNPVSVGYHTLALKAINNKLSNPRSSTSETVVYSITGFMCYNVRNPRHSL